MKTKILFFTVIILTVFSCSKDGRNELQGTWKLTEVLADPGDGSGTFIPVSSNKKLIFSNDGNLSSNGDICDMSIESNENSTGTYLEANATINSSHCPDYTITYILNGSTLILVYPCFEPCKAKYIKIQ